MNAPEIITAIRQLNNVEELSHVYEVALERLRWQRSTQNRQNVRVLKVGATVSFQHPNQGVLQGTVVKRNRTTVTVQTPTAGKWRVPPSMLSQV